MKIEAARLMVYTAAARAERGEPNLGFISSAAKCFASDVAMEVTTNAVQLFGGYGYTVDFPVELEDDVWTPRARLEQIIATQRELASMSLNASSRFGPLSPASNARP